MSLSSFSSLLDFAIKQQKDAADFFALDNSLYKERFAKLHDEAKKNIKNLETILRENVAEIIMEPLEELNESDYSLQLDGIDALQASINILEKQTRFFQDAAKVINLKDVKRIFEKLATKSGAV